MLSLVRKYGLFALALAFFVGFWTVAANGYLSLPARPPQQATAINKPSDSPNYQSAYRTSPEAADDRIAKYTWWLTAFTAALVIVSAIQIGFLLRAERLTRNSINLARSEFVSSHRPRLRVRLFRLDKLEIGKPISVIYEVANIGDTRARIVDSEIGIWMPDINGSRVISVTRSVAITHEIVGGEALLVEQNTGFPCPERHFLHFLDGRLRVNGMIRYADDNGVLRRTVFSRVCDEPSGHVFRRLDPPNPEREYED